MNGRSPQAPPARLALVFHTPTIARVEVMYRPLPGRLLRAAVSLALCWGALPLLVWVPPHYPWIFGAFVAGIYLPYRFLTGKYVVLSFTGFCPRCGRPLELRRGSKINLPHALTCFGCHFEPVLEVSLIAAAARAAPAADAVRIEHRAADCPGRWQTERGAFALSCTVCGARHCATPAARRAAEEENRRGDLLADLTSEGRFLL